MGELKRRKVAPLACVAARCVSVWPAERVHVIAIGHVERRKMTPLAFLVSRYVSLLPVYRAGHEDGRHGHNGYELSEEREGVIRRFSLACRTCTCDSNRYR
jgi:hypothetical protein